MTGEENTKSSPWRPKGKQLIAFLSGSGLSAICFYSKHLFQYWHATHLLLAALSEAALLELMVQHRLIGKDGLTRDICLCNICCSI